MFLREPMTPAEFDAACRDFERRVWSASCTSGRRSVERNRAVDGHPESKHLIGMARDYAYERDDWQSAFGVAEELGFHTLFYPWGCHVQGLPVGPLPDWWVAKFGGLPDE